MIGNHKKILFLNDDDISIIQASPSYKNMMDRITQFYQAKRDLRSGSNYVAIKLQCILKSIKECPKYKKKEKLYVPSKEMKSIFLDWLKKDLLAYRQLKAMKIQFLTMNRVQAKSYLDFILGEDN